MDRLVVFSDALCPWATVVVLRLHEARARAGADGELAIVHRALPLELLLERPIARRVVDAEIPLCASLTPEFGWSLWQGRSEEYPATSLLAAEAIQAATRASIDGGLFRGTVMADFRASRARRGSRAAAPWCCPTAPPSATGTRTGWIGGSMPRGTPVLIDDDPSAHDRLVSAALAARVG